MTGEDPKFFEERKYGTGSPRAEDARTAYQRDRARLLHSAAFRRLQGKTQVMGVGEGDFHRTRLTHSIECAQIGSGLLQTLNSREDVAKRLGTWMPCRDLIEAACFAHDIGHPPYGHGGEKALHILMRECGGFEGNGHTLRIIARLEKYREPKIGIDPTRRLVLAILKYPVPYSAYDPAWYSKKPPKCFFDGEKGIVDWALEGFSEADRAHLMTRTENDKPRYRTFDCSLMEIADDIAYGVHDIEDVVGRKLADRESVENQIEEVFEEIGGSISVPEPLKANDVIENLFKGSYKRKQIIGRLINLFVASVTLQELDCFEHPLLRFRSRIPCEHEKLLEGLKSIAYDLIVKKPQVQQLEQRGQRLITKLFKVLKDDPAGLVPGWDDRDTEADPARAVCDYVAGMTDAYAERVFRRLFIPGYGSAGDEL